MFLNSGKAIKDRIECLVNEEVSGTMKLAVAFWGTGIEQVLRGPNQIICDLDSGACNPTVIRALRKNPQFVVMKLPRFHAKVVISTAGAIVSSANMSTNGLGEEGADYSGTIEAGYYIESKNPEYRKILAWFDEIWNRATEITESDLVHAEAKYKFRNRDLAYLPDVEIHHDTEAYSVDPSEFLQEEIRKGNRLRAVHKRVFDELKGTVSESNHRQQGILMTWAVHLLLNRTGQVLNHCENEPADNKWITDRMKGPNQAARQLQVEAILRAISRDSLISRNARRAASEVLANPPWNQ